MGTAVCSEVPPPTEAFQLRACLITVRAGLQIIRYESARDAESPPVVLIQAMPEDFAQVTLLSSKDSLGFSLEAPGDAIVVRALRDVRLVATTATLGWLGADAAVLAIERIDGQRSDSRRAGGSIARVELIDNGARLSGSMDAEPAVTIG